MVDATEIAGFVTGLLLAVVGGLGALDVFGGTVAGAMEWTGIAWLLLVLFVGGGGLAAYAGALLAGELVEAVTGGGLGDRTKQVDASRIGDLID